MRLDQIPARFESLICKGLVCKFNAGATVEIVHHTEKHIGLKLPKQVVAFWETMDGLDVDDPHLQLLPLSGMVLEDNLLIFGTCNREVRLAFDTSKENEAGQWFTLNADTGYQITFTMASFWSTHMWSWITKRRPIWYDIHSAVT